METYSEMTTREAKERDRKYRLERFTNMLRTAEEGIAFQNARLQDDNVAKELAALAEKIPDDCITTGLSMMGSAIIPGGQLIRTAAIQLAEQLSNAIARRNAQVAELRSVYETNRTTATRALAELESEF